jgi:Fe-only nitrogenase accessory protein AnfO
MCTEEIAVLLGSDGRTVPLSEPGTMVVFRRNRRQWVRVREMTLALDPAKGLVGLRSTLAALIGFFGNCKTVVAMSASGALFFELEKARCSVWEIAGSPDEFLEQVWRDEKEELAAEPLPAGVDIPAPLEIAPGRYYISIREIQGKRPEVSSKQVLQQFLQRGDFAELEIICDHVPPWIEVEAERRGYEIVSEKTAQNEVKVILSKSSASGCC